MSLHGFMGQANSELDCCCIIHLRSIEIKQSSELPELKLLNLYQLKESLNLISLMQNPEFTRPTTKPKFRPHGLQRDFRRRGDSGPRGIASSLANCR